ncbi:MAG TPA: GNAT family N-acetyltransferase [Acidimicrobiia bacterium]|nr:GNAT family N-acetyltransferase [Acidimicrobiia bacterium]
MRVEEVPAEATHDLRWRVLRDSRPGAPVVFPEDARAGCFHLGVRAAGNSPLLAVASFSPEPTPYRPGAGAVHLRGMAVDRPSQHHGLGRLLITHAVERLQRAGVVVLWCNARDSAAGFYERMGFAVFGAGFVLTESGLSHHVMLRDL